MRKLTHGLTVVGLVGAVAGMLALAPVEAQAQGYWPLEHAIVAVTNGVGYYENTGGAPLRLVSITSCATGGSLSAYVDLMVGGAGVTLQPVGTNTPIVTIPGPGTNIVRSITVGATDYLWHGQRLYLSTSNAIANHVVFVTLEKRE